MTAPTIPATNVLFDRLAEIDCRHGCGTVSVHTPGFFANGSFGNGLACAACPDCVGRVLALFTEHGIPADLMPIGQARAS
jgi:hypothetical protein